MSNHDWGDLIGGIVEGIVESLPLPWWSLLILVVAFGAFFYFL